MALEQIEITIIWTMIGEAYVQVTETSTESCEGSSETLFVTVDACLGLTETTFPGVKLYPNPAQNYISIDFTSADLYEINIYDQFGQQVFVEKAQSINEQPLYQIDISSFASGLYFIKMTNSSNQVYKTKSEIIK